MTSAVRRNLGLLAILLATAVLAWIPRDVAGQQHFYDKTRTDWFSRDPDGLYHARRIERALREGSVAETDPRMNFPDGARIPWPPYYDRVLASAFAPFVPDAQAQRRAWIERATASMPRVFGIAAALLAALAAWRLAGATGALVAGVTVALCRGSINYSVVGCGDHHAWIAFLSAASLLVMSEAFARGALASLAKSALYGAALGVLCGLMIGSWAAALLYVVGLQLALGWMLWRRAREALPGLALFGLATHVVAALVLMPAVLSSPWRAEFPWMVVNLSWFHFAELALGALVFVAPLCGERSFLAHGTRAARLYPLLVAVALAALGGACWALELAPARGIAAGFEWVSRADQFMDQVGESLPLVGARAESGVLFLALGYGVLALPLALAAAGWCALRRNVDALLPWFVATATLLPQALLQRRFADPLAVPMAVVLAWGAARLVERGPRAVLAPLFVAAAFAAQIPSLSRTRAEIGHERSADFGAVIDFHVGERRAFEWIAAQARGDDAWSVLTHWDRGHMLEWAANAPSVATNFGSYLGLDSYRDPSVFFLSETPSAARALLERRRVRYVYAPAALLSLVNSMCRVAAPQMRERYLAPGGRAGTLPTERWYATMGARLLVGGTPSAPSGALVGPEPAQLPYLRLVHVTPYRDTRFREPVTGLPFPAGFVWERVAGALLEAHGASGEELLVEFDVAFPAARYRLPWRARAVVDASGVASLRIPYATDAPNGDGTVENARWRIGERSGALAIGERAVLSGASVRLP